MRKGTFSACYVFTLIVLFATAVNAQWQEDGAGVCTDALGQEVVYPATDGEGGAYIVWRDARNGNYDIYAQRLDSFGNALWTADGVAVCTESDLQDRPRVTADGVGGCIIAWTDFRGTEIDIYAQRLNGAGSAQWTPNGVLVCGATSTQDQVELIPDGSGGAILTWIDERTYATTMTDIYTQRLSSAGAPQWTPNGVAICNSANNQTVPQITADGKGGAWIIWMDYRNGSHLDIYFNQISASGTATWSNTGIGICTEIGNQWAPQIVGDGYGGFYATWYDFRGGGTSDIYAQGLANNYTFRWTSNGIAVCTAANNQDSHVLVTDGSGGIIVAWRDYRNSEYDLYAQRISAGGSPQWATDGIALCTGNSTQNYPRMVSDGAGGAVVSWVDSRNGYTDIYCQRINGSGTPQWETNGLVVCKAIGEQTDAWPVVDGEGGAIVAWKDLRPGTLYDIYAQRIERNGYWGYPAPDIYAIRDVPGDQGGYVNLAWDASRIDPWPDLAIDYYSLWRAIDPVQAASMLEGGTMLLSGIGDFSRNLTERVFRTQQVDGTTYYWELVTTKDANGYEHYASAIPTLFDSTAVSTEQHFFQVCAHGANPGEAWTSQPDSGYSVDNLAPAAPTSLAGKQSIGPNGLLLTWDPNTESDLSHYAVYRDIDAAFLPGSGNLIASPSDTTAFDDEWTWDSGYYYKVSAIDIHGNESLWAVVGPEHVTGTGDGGAPPVTTFLGQSYPNPFVGSTTISYGVSRRGEATLEVYDVAGRLVRVLASGTHEVRRHEAAWDGCDAGGRRVASGIYFYRLKTGSFEQTRKVVLVR
jgi:hypothetical protein